jgi:hypothetical protein
LSLPSIHEALGYVRDVQQALVERQRFKGYSGPARMASGTIALMAAAVMAAPFYPAHPYAHLAGWGAVFVVAFLMNTVALATWFFFDPLPGRDPRALKPIIDIVPPLAVGGLLTATMIMHGRYEYLFGIWMCLFGLSNMASRIFLPRLVWFVGLFYLGAGAVCLLAPRIDFANPWPMGIVFFAGEWAGGLVLYHDGTRRLPLAGDPEEGA